MKALQIGWHHHDRMERQVAWLGYDDGAGLASRRSFHASHKPANVMGSPSERAICLARGEFFGAAPPPAHNQLAAHVAGIGSGSVAPRGAGGEDHVQRRAVRR